MKRFEISPDFFLFKKKSNTKEMIRHRAPDVKSEDTEASELGEFPEELE